MTRHFTQGGGYVIRELVPFLLVEIAVMLLVTYVPILSTWLPHVMSK